MEKAGWPRKTVQVNRMPSTIESSHHPHRRAQGKGESRLAEERTRERVTIIVKTTERERLEKKSNGRAIRP